jgi:hypothetical protein
LFNPFNEANKAFYPFIPYLKKIFKRGDIILDVWSRTGWSHCLLDYFQNKKSFGKEILMHWDTMVFVLVLK